MSALKLQSLMDFSPNLKFPVKFGVWQGSVWGLSLFSLFCNVLPDISGNGDGKIHVYVDDTTMYVATVSSKTGKDVQMYSFVFCS